MAAILPVSEAMTAPLSLRETEKKRERTERIAELKGLLAATDYIAAKISEGAATREEYADKLTERQSWRDEINAIDEA